MVMTAATSQAAELTLNDDKAPVGKASSLLQKPRRGDPWMDDGTIILQAQDVGFRVHRSVLARNSDVFADMFQIPQPEEPTDDQVFMEGCLILVLSDDPSELGHFLRAMYDGRRYFGSDIILPFEAIMALIRLGSKYQALHLREEGMSRLHPVMDSLLSCNESSNSPLELYKRKCAITLANLAETHDLDEFLPQALYACCQIPESQLRNAGGLPSSDDDSEEREGPSSRAAFDGLTPEPLLPVNIERVLLARTRLAAHTEEILKSMTVILGGARVCQRAFASNVAQCWSKLPTSVPQTNPLRWLQVWCEGMEKAWLCSPMCLMNAKAFKNKRVADIRHGLSEYFGLSETTSTRTQPYANQRSVCTCAPISRA